MSFLGPNLPKSFLITVLRKPRAEIHEDHFVIHYRVPLANAEKQLDRMVAEGILSAEDQNGEMWLK